MLNTDDNTGRLITAAHRVLKALLDMAKRDGEMTNYITYGVLNRDHIQMDSIVTRNLGEVLDLVRETCLQNGLPDLACLVVNKETLKPGQRYLDTLGHPWEEELRRVREFDWSRIGTLHILLKVKML